MRCRILQYLHSTQSVIRLRAMWMLLHANFWPLDCLWIVRLAVTMSEGAYLCVCVQLSLCLIEWLTESCLLFLFIPTSVSLIFSSPIRAFLKQIHKAPGLGKFFVQAETFWIRAQMALCKFVLPQGKSCLTASFCWLSKNCATSKICFTFCLDTQLGYWAVFKKGS